MRGAAPCHGSAAALSLLRPPPSPALARPNAGQLAARPGRGQGRRRADLHAHGEVRARIRTHIWSWQASEMASTLHPEPHAPCALNPTQITELPISMVRLRAAVGWHLASARCTHNGMHTRKHTQIHTHSLSLSALTHTADGVRPHRRGALCRVCRVQRREHGAADNRRRASLPGLLQRRLDPFSLGWGVRLVGGRRHATSLL